MHSQDAFKNQEYILKYKPDNEYVPLYSLYLPRKVSDNYQNYVSPIEAPSFELKQLSDRVKNSSLLGHINYYNTFFDYGDWKTLSTAKANLETYLNNIENYLKADRIDSGIYKYRSSSTYAKRYMLNYIDNPSRNELSEVEVYSKYTSDKYILGNLFACSYNQSKLVPIFTMVVKKEYVEYVKACYLMDKQPKSLAFEFWIRTGFDSKDTKEPYLRTHVYRKHIKKLLIEKNIPIIEKDNWFEDLYNINKQPVFKTLRDRKDWLNSISESFTKHLNPYVEEDTSFCESEYYPIELSDMLTNTPAPNPEYTWDTNGRIIRSSQLTTGEGVISQINRNASGIIYNPEVARRQMREWLISDSRDSQFNNSEENS